MRRFIFSRWLGLLVIPGLLGTLAAFERPRAEAETCLSPFVKGLDRRERFLYVFCVDAAAAITISWL